MGYATRSRAGRWALYTALAGTLGGCGAADERPGRAAQRLDAHIFKKAQEPLLPKNPQAYDEFGAAIGVSSRWAAIGSPGDDFPATPEDPYDDTGSATLFERKQGNVWEEMLTLFPEQGWPGARFGEVIAATNDLIVVGASKADPSLDGSMFGAGRVASFSYSGGRWTAEGLLQPPEDVDYRFFGEALALDEHTLLVGADGTDQVFAFDRTASGWSPPVSIDSPLPPGSGFGFSVALDEPYAFVGAPFADADGEGEDDDRGAVLIFKHEGTAWLQVGKLVPKFESAGDLFGAALGAHHGLAVATAFGDGSASIAELDGNGDWGQPFRVAAGQSASTSGFGRSVAIAGRNAVWVGASDESQWDGAVYPFFRTENDQWLIGSGLSFTDGGRFGFAIGSASGALMVGAPSAGDASQGAVYVIATSDGSACQEDSDCFSGHCVGHTCCDTSCDAPCFSCFADEKASGSADGTCEPRLSGARVEGCVDSGAQSCSTNGLCDDAGHCALYPAGTQCADPFCSDDDLVGAALCDGEGTCTPPSATSCENFACADGACQSKCKSDADCHADAYCDDARCRPKSGLGAACASDSACLQGHCADGVCCNRACDGACETCGTGDCLALPSGATPRAASEDDAGEICARLLCDGVHGQAASMLPDAQVTCSAPGCRDGVEVGEGRCDGAGQCMVSETKNCGAYACSSSDDDPGRPAQCLTTCDGSSDCASDFYCTTDHECRAIDMPPHESKGCSTSGAGGGKWSCLQLLTSAIAVLALRRRRSTARNHHAPCASHA